MYAVELFIKNISKFPAKKTKRHYKLHEQQPWMLLIPPTPWFSCVIITINIPSTTSTITWQPMPTVIINCQHKQN